MDENPELVFYGDLPADYDETAVRLPGVLYRWVEAFEAKEALAQGFPEGAYYTIAGGDPALDWHPDIYYLFRPCRLSISTIDFQIDQLGPDIGSADYDQEISYETSWQESLARLGNVFYQGAVAQTAIFEVKEFPAPRSWKLDWNQPEAYGYEEGRDFVWNQGGAGFTWKLGSQNFTADIEAGGRGL